MLKRIILFPLYLPHLLCYLFSKQKPIIDEDMVAWTKYRPGLIGMGNVDRLISLLTHQKDFRAQFYLRIGKMRVLLRWLLPDIKCYSFEGCQIGGGWVLMHGFGVVLNGSAKIGKNCTMYHGVTIGTIDLKTFPQIGDDVFIGADAKILGNIRVGNHVKIGAGAIVVNDVPDNCTVVGPKAKVIGVEIIAELDKFL
jgi:serine O-acetyltransferase